MAPTARHDAYMSLLKWGVLQSRVAPPPKGATRACKSALGRLYKRSRKKGLKGVVGEEWKSLECKKELMETSIRITHKDGVVIKAPSPQSASPPPQDVSIYFC